MKDKVKHLNKLSMALALGTTWGLCMLLSGWLSAFGLGSSIVKTFSDCYMGFGPGFVGGILGGIWGFVDGFIGGAVLSFLYNFFSSKRK